MLELRPISRLNAISYINDLEPEAGKPAGKLYAFSAWDPVTGEMQAAALAGLPVLLKYSDGLTAEVTAASGSDRNRPEALLTVYAAACRACFALGYKRILVYTDDAETAEELKQLHFNVYGSDRINGKIVYRWIRESGKK